MFSFIRKRLPSKDRSHEHQNDNEIKKAQSTNELNLNINEKKKQKKNKKKEISSSTIDGLVLAPNTSPINKSYSDVDYFPMMPGALSQSINHDKTLKNHDSLSDCYFNPSEIVQTTSDNNYVQATVIKPQVFEIPVIDCRQEQRIPNYKGIDHQRTKALREVITEQRTQQRLIK